MPREKRILICERQKSSMSTKIDKDIIPDEPLRKMKHPWLELGIGDSFEIDASLKAAQSHARNASLRYGRTFQAGKSRGRVRVWRWK